MNKTQVVKKAAKITATVLTYVFIIVCIIGVIFTITAKKDADGTATIMGIQLRTVLSPSMEKCDATDVSGFKIKDIPVKSMVFVEVMPTDPKEAEEWYANLKIGDVLTFKYVYVKQETITHRITGIRYEGEGLGYTIQLQGDNKNSDSETLTQTINTADANSPNYIIGKVVGQSYLLGLFVSALKSPIGLVLIVIIPSLIIAVLEVLKIVKVLTADKKKAAEEKMAAQQNELDELKRRLAELEASKEPKRPEPDTPPDAPS